MARISDKDLVKEILEKHRYTRDSTPRLYFYFLKEKGYNVGIKSAIQLLQDIDKKIIPEMDTIARISRKLQSLYPDLEGGKRKFRMMREKEVREEYSPRKKFM